LNKKDVLRVLDTQLLTTRFVVAKRFTIGLTLVAI